MWRAPFGDFLPHLPISLCVPHAASVLLHIILQSSLLTSDTITPLSPPSPCQRASFRDWCLAYLQAQLPAGAAALPTSLLPRRTTSLSEWGRTTLFTHDQLAVCSWKHQVSMKQITYWSMNVSVRCMFQEVLFGRSPPLSKISVANLGNHLGLLKWFEARWEWSTIQRYLLGLYHLAMGSFLPHINGGNICFFTLSSLLDKGKMHTTLGWIQLDLSLSLTQFPFIHQPLWYLYQQVLWISVSLFHQHKI